MVEAPFATSVVAPGTEVATIDDDKIAEYRTAAVVARAQAEAKPNIPLLGRWLKFADEWGRMADECQLNPEN